jgi:uncharacterized protein (DUF2267 family)
VRGCAAARPVYRRACPHEFEEAGVQYDEFISKVAERSGVERDRADAVVRATLATLATRITPTEADDLAAQLPQQLKEPLLSGPEHPERFDPTEFVRRVAGQAELSEEQAGNAVRAVFATLSEAVTGGEFDDILAQLPDEYGQLVAAAPTSSVPREQSE